MLDPSRVINGAFAEVWHEGQWVTNATSIEANVDIGKEEVQLSGSRWVGHKSTSLTGTGTMGAYKVTSDWVVRVGSINSDRGLPFTTELIVKLDDPEQYGAYRVRLKNVTFDNIPLITAEVGSLVEEELNFTFVGYELLDTFTAN